MKNYIDLLKIFGIKFYFPNFVTNETQHIQEYATANKPSNSKISINQNKKIAKNFVDKVQNYSLNKKIISKNLEQLDSETNDLINLIRNQILNINSLEKLKQYVLDFQYCKLKFFAKNTVFSDGNAQNPKIMVIGEAPGEKEDLQGKPFCGRSGILLDKILLAINLSRDTNSYITNTVFWRPPANRRPTQTEIEICKPIVEKHIAIIKPNFILLTGNTAIKSLLSSDVQISNFQGKIMSYNNMYLENSINLSAIFHPSYLLRQASKKKETWKSLLQIQKFL
ncbi:MAG: uracil-DNA glycosylase [Rickettsia sp.]|nr:uracil-DNA glycosylase [Rickettsia sp.]